MYFSAIHCGANRWAGDEVALPAHLPASLCERMLACCVHTFFLSVCASLCVQNLFPPPLLQPSLAEKPATPPATVSTRLSLCYTRRSRKAQKEFLSIKSTKSGKSCYLSGILPSWALGHLHLPELTTSAAYA